MAEYRLDANVPDKLVVPSTLKLGGVSPSGDRIGFTNYYMELNGEPYFGICGEFHYSRYPAGEWETELSKMKLSGINIVATYIFWNHHEEKEGAFSWEGNLALRRFIELCASQGLYLILRVGPFCHGEARNGGLPDWLFGRPFEIRSNDERYLAYVRRLYEEIGRQSKGLFFGDGGPVIGVQLENEYMHAAAIWELTAKQGDEYMTPGADGKPHMRLLKAMAQEAGLVAPIYTSTGWGGAPVAEDEVLPLYGGYAYTPWTVNADNPEQRPTGEYVFADYHNEDGASPGFEPPYAKSKYPFACCEMGGGMQAWYMARFVVEPESVAAMALMKIAGGCNFVGYYMFHGGTNPVGRFGYLNESTTPKLTYDFQAPIGEFGQVRESAARLRLIHAFLHRFGAALAPMRTVLPEGAAVAPSDTDTLRYAARVRGDSGFLFVNNYQDHLTMNVHEDVRFRVELEGGTVVFPKRASFTVKDKTSVMLPLGFDMDGIRLEYATAQPITKVETEDGAPVYFFAMPEGTAVEFGFRAEGIARLTMDGAPVERDESGFVATMTGERSARLEAVKEDGKPVRVYVMTAEESLTLWEAEFRGRRRAVFSERPFAAAGEGLRFFTEDGEPLRFRILPGTDAVLGAVDQGVSVRRLQGAGAYEWFDAYEVRLAPTKEIGLEVEMAGEHKAIVRVPADAFLDAEELLLSVDYDGNVGYAFADGELFHDHFHNGEPWEIGLRRFRDRVEGKEIVLHITPRVRGKLTAADDVGMAIRHTLEGSKVARIRSVKASAVRGATVM